MMLSKNTWMLPILSKMEANEECPPNASLNTNQIKKLPIETSSQMEQETPRKAQISFLNPSILITVFRVILS